MPTQITRVSNEFTTLADGAEKLSAVIAKVASDITAVFGETTTLLS